LESEKTGKKANYTIGSVFNHVCMHQTVAGLEALKQFAMAEDYPDEIYGCIGGGSSFSGLFWPFYNDKISKKAQKETSFLSPLNQQHAPKSPAATTPTTTATQPNSPRLSLCTPSDTTSCQPPSTQVDLRYHGIAPTISVLAQEKKISTIAVNQVDAFDAAKIFIRSEGIIPSPESAHAIKAVIDEALPMQRTNQPKRLLFALTGHGFFDMTAYEEYFAGKLQPYEYPTEKVAESMDKLRKLYPWLNEATKKYIGCGPL
jgi:tryptophan synthase beta chain